MQESVPFRPLRAIPILRIFDLAKAREFYLDFLGFTLDWEHHFDDVAPRYLQVSLGDLVLHLSEHHGDACPGSTVFVPVEGLRCYQRALIGKAYGYLRPSIQETGHGSLGMEVIDPFGNRLRFDEALPDMIDATIDA